MAWVTVDRVFCEFLSGNPQPFQASPGVVRTFCGSCGSPLTFEESKAPDSLDVATVALDHADGFAPTRELWLDHKLTWEAVDADHELKQQA